MIDREERIKIAKEKLKKLEPAKEAYENAKSELRRAENSFDIGERVKYTETCRRGCCIEKISIGIIKSFDNKYGRYTIKLNDESTTINNIYVSDLERIGNKK